MPPGTPVVFDVLGTCFSFAGCRDALGKVFPTVAAEHASSIIDDWFHAAQRDFTCALCSYLPENHARPADRRPHWPPPLLPARPQTSR